MRENERSAPESTASAVLIPGRHEQPHKRHGDQSKHDAAEEGFDHGGAGGSGDAQFFHDQRRPRETHRNTVISPSSTPPAAAAPSPVAGDQQPPAQRRSLAATLATLAAVACILLVVVVLPAARSDPYTRQTLELTGSATDGGRLFRLNCAGCHGLAAQGLVGPDLHGVERRKNDRQLIQQVVSGRTPPMPSFQPEPQAMADLLAFLHSLP